MGYRPGSKVKTWSPEHGPRSVFVSTQIKFLDRIDVYQQQFACTLIITLQWMVGAEEKRLWALNPKEYKDYWTPPDVEISNAHTMTVKTSKCKVTLEGHMLMARTTQTVVGTFSEVMELQNFPFDCQDFTLNMVFPESTEHFELTPSFNTSEVVAMLQDAKQLPEYTFTDPMLEMGVTRTNQQWQLQSDLSSKEIQYPTMVIRLKASRNWRGYVWKNVVTMAMVSFAVLFAYQIPIDLLAEKLAHVVTLYLTAIAFQQVVSDNLPQIDYQTLLDKYILHVNIFILMTMLIMVFVEYCRVTYGEDEYWVDLLEKNSFWLAFFGWGLVHVHFFMKAAIAWHKVEAPKLNYVGKYEDIETPRRLGVNSRLSITRGDARIYFGSTAAFKAATGQDVHVADFNGVWFSEDGWFAEDGGASDVDYVRLGPTVDSAGQLQLFGRRVAAMKDATGGNYESGMIAWYTTGGIPIVGGPAVTAVIGNPNEDQQGLQTTLEAVSRSELRFKNEGTYSRFAVESMQSQPSQSADDGTINIEAMMDKSKAALKVPLLSEMQGNWRRRQQLVHSKTSATISDTHEPTSEQGLGPPMTEMMPTRSKTLNF